MSNNDAEALLLPVKNISDVSLGMGPVSSGHPGPVQLAVHFCLGPSIKHSHVSFTAIDESSSAHTPQAGRPAAGCVYVTTQLDPAAFQFLVV